MVQSIANGIFLAILVNASKLGIMIGIGVNGYYLMKRVTQSNYGVDFFNINTRSYFKPGDMVLHPSTGHVGILIEKEDRGVMWVVEWFMGPRGETLDKHVQTYEYNKSLVLYAKGVEA